ncbi:MAG TPA: alpha/beta hydrolase [Solirubrobacteraceae bacterium]|nr:alpha/beta hydrolase [Solirubrobacteraceae bacterium]
MSDIAKHTEEIGGLPVFWRSAQAPATAGVGDPAPVLYLHGVPTSSDDWLGFLERTGGLAPDLPGFGRSGKPGYLKFTIEEYAAFIERFLDTIGVESVRLVVHDWGAVGLAFAQAHPERVERLVVTNAVPFLPGYRWHRTARIWRTPVLGELAMGATTRWTLKQSTRESNAKPGPMPKEWLDSVMAHMDQGTQRAILRLYRSSPSEVLAKAGERLSTLDMPALVVWGAKDPYIPTRFGEEYARALPDSELLVLPDAGHWWWMDRPDAVERVAEFLLAG